MHPVTTTQLRPLSRFVRERAKRELPSIEPPWPRRWLAAALALVVAAAPTARAQGNCSVGYGAAWYPTLGGPPGLNDVDLSGDGNHVVFGARAVVTVFGQTGGAWVVANPASPSQTEALLTPWVSCGLFGNSVAMDEEARVVVVGAPNISGGAVGRTFVYRRSGSQWVGEFSSTGVGLDNFGESVAVTADGARFAAGAPSRLQTLTWDVYRGAIDIFRHEPTGWVLEASLFPTDVVLNHHMGYSVAFSGDGRFVAGRTNGSTNSSHPSGAVYVFERTGVTWTPVAKLLDQVVYSGWGFGWSLSFDYSGTLLAAGNPFDSRWASEQGAVSVFSRSGGLWSFQSVLLPHVPAFQGRFGSAVDLTSNGADVLIGAPRQWSGGAQCGVIERYRRSGGAWQYSTTYVHPAAQPGDRFGSALAADPSGTRFAATAPGSDTYGVNFGEAHFFRGNCLTPTTYCTSQTSSNGCTPQIAAAGTASVSSSSGFVISASQVRSQQNGMLFYGTNGRATTAWLGGTLCVQPPLRRTPVINSGGNFGAPDCSGVLSRDFNTWTSTAGDPSLFVGQLVRAQFYSRDPGAGSNLNLSDAVEFYLEL